MASLLRFFLTKENETPVRVALCKKLADRNSQAPNLLRMSSRRKPPFEAPRAAATFPLLLLRQGRNTPCHRLQPPRIYGHRERKKLLSGLLRSFLFSRVFCFLLRFLLFSEPTAQRPHGHSRIRCHKAVQRRKLIWDGGNSVPHSLILRHTDIYSH